MFARSGYIVLIRRSEKLSRLGYLVGIVLTQRWDWDGFRDLPSEG
jgi:hypothetical protein